MSSALRRAAYRDDAHGAARQMSLCVLVVEDSPTQLIRIRADLEPYRFRVLEARDGAEALEAARRDRPDVVLSDVLMPGMDGFRLCREMQLDPQLRDIPLVLRTTAFVSEEDKEFALRLGARAYIQKEIDPGDLAALLNKLPEAHVDRADLVEQEEFHGSYENRLLTRLVDEAAQLEAANEELRESRAQLQAILDHTPAYIYAKDLEGRFTVMNEHFRSAGVDPEVMIGRDQAELGRDYADQWAANDRRVVDEGRSIHVEETIPTPEGERTILSAKFPLLDAEGEVTAVSGVSMDITDRIQMEQRLRQAERMEALGRLSGGVAHDFNNLLTIISNYARFVADDLGPESPSHEDLEQVQAAAERGASLVRQLLAFGGRGRTNEAAEVDLNEAIREIESLIRVSLGSRVELMLDLDADIPSVTIDPTNVDQIILNLASNSRDAMPNGGSLRITTGRELLTRPTPVGDSQLPPGEYVVVAVSDTGIGMTESTRRKLFEPFFTTKGEAGGTGLGLATTHGIVQAAGGAIEVRSQVGEGSTFSIWLPMTDEEPDHDRAAGDTLVLPVIRTVLVVDDEASIRAIVHRALEPHGYSVVEAASGEEALRVWEEQGDSLDLILSDIRMPGGISGIRLAQILNARGATAPIVHMSGSEDSVLPGSLVKPFTAEDLLAVVRGRSVSAADDR